MEIGGREGEAMGKERVWVEQTTPLVEKVTFFSTRSKHIKGFDFLKIIIIIKNSYLL